MADIIDTLHPKNIPSDNLYPNIKTANIPDKGVTKEKLADGSIDESKLEGGSLEKIVNEWLTAHPEATTTVQDNSITPVKLTDDVYGVLSNDGFHLNLISRIVKQVSGSYVLQDGTIGHEPSVKVSDYIDISDKYMLKLKVVVNDLDMPIQFCIFDSDKNGMNMSISDLLVSETDHICIYALPKNAKYIRINSISDDALNLANGNFAYLYNDNKYVTNTVYPNLYNPTLFDYTPHKFIDDNGSISPGGDVSVINKIPVVGFNRMKMHFTLGGKDQLYKGVFFDKNDNLVGTVNERTIDLTSDNVTTIDIPSNASYCKLNTYYSYAKTLKENCYAYLYNSVDHLSKIAYKYGDSIQKPYDFNGKKLLAFGDSITQGFSSPNLTVIRDSYIQLFADKFGMNLNNKAIGGSTITNSNGAISSIYSIYYVITHTTDDTDFIIISGGVNDYQLKKPVGSYGDTDSTTFYGALHGICEYLKTTYPDKPVIFITPVNVTRDIKNIPMDRLNLYRNAIYEVATSYGYDVVNGIDMIPVDGQGGWNNTMIDDSDGIHPTASGHALYFRNLCGKLL